MYRYILPQTGSNQDILPGGIDKQTDRSMSWNITQQKKVTHMHI